MGETACAWAEPRWAEPVGSDVYVTVELNGETLKLRAPADCPLDRGDAARFRFHPGRIHLFSARTGEALLRGER